MELLAWSQLLKGTMMLNLDTEEDGDLCVGCAGGTDVNIFFNLSKMSKLLMVM